MRLISEKLILLSLLFILGLAAGVGPHLLRNRCMTPSRWRDKFVSLLNCFSAGVFCATFFMHMMPEAQKEFSAVFGDVEYPFAELLLSAGFFFVMVIEQTVMNWYEKKQRKEKEKLDLTIANLDASNSLHNHSDGAISPLATAINNNLNYNTMTDSMDSKSVASFRHRLNESVSTTFTEVNCDEDIPIEDDVLENRMSVSIKMNDISKVNSSLATSREVIPPDDHLESHDHHNHIEPHFSIRSFILLFALSTHALFEGLAIGFQTSAPALRSLMVAVVIHKMALAFSFGISLVNNQAKLLNVLISMFVFSVMAPIGIGIGTALNSFKAANSTIEMVVAVMQAFAAGTFVYVIFIEIIPHEFVTAKSENRLWKLFCLGVGFAGMAALQAIPHEEE